MPCVYNPHARHGRAAPVDPRECAECMQHGRVSRALEKNNIDYFRAQNYNLLYKLHVRDDARALPATLRLSGEATAYATAYLRYNVNRREGRTSPPTPSSSSEESTCGGKSWPPVRPRSCAAPSAFTSAATPSSPTALDEHAAALCRRAGSRVSRPTLPASISVSISRRERSGAGSAGRLPSGSCDDSELLLPCK